MCIPPVTLSPMDHLSTESPTPSGNSTGSRRRDEATPDAGRFHIGTLSYTGAGLVVLFCWLLWGDFAYQIRDRAVGPTLQLLLSTYHASNTIIGLLTGVLPPIIVIVLSPIISYMSDRHRGRGGRRIPYLLFITPITVIALLGLAFTHQIGAFLHQLIHLHSFDHSALASIAIFWTIFAACDMICNLIFIALCNDVVPREIIGRFFGLFRVVSLGAGMVFQFFFLKKAEVHYVAIFVTVAAIYGIGFTATCLKVKEGQYPPPEANAPNPWRATIDYARNCFRHSRYRWLFASIALANMSFVPINLFLIYFAKAVHLDLGILGKCFALQLFLSLILAYPLGWLSDRIHPLRLTIISLIMFIGAALLSYLLVRGPLGVAVAAVTVGTFAGWWLTANGPLCMTLFPKVQFAQFLAAMNVCSNIGMLIVGSTCGLFLDHVHSDYHYIYLWSFVLAGISLLATFVVYHKFSVNGRLPKFAEEINT